MTDSTQEFSPVTNPNERNRIVIVDMGVKQTSPAGSCVLAEARGLCSEYDLSIFSESCDLAGEPGVEWIRVPAPKSPILLRYLCFHALVPLLYLTWRLRNRAPYAIQATQGQFPTADIAYAHFCHKAYLKNQWKLSSVSGLLRLVRWFNHRFNAFCEARAFARARIIVVPSLGLAHELAREYPGAQDKTVCIANPVDLEFFRKPAEFDGKLERARHDIAPDALLLAFVALGDFSRKGLGLIIDGLAEMQPAQHNPLRVVVVGGKDSEIATFRAYAETKGIASFLTFVGMQADVRPFLWMADAFAFPSAYEIFSLATLQAAAAGLPALVSQGLYGVEEYVQDNIDGWAVPRHPEDVLQGLQRIVADRHRLKEMGADAAASVHRYSSKEFVKQWLTLFANMK